MKFSTTTLLTAASTALTLVSASPAPVSLNRRQGGWWGGDECLAEAGGTVLGGDKLWELRNTWNDAFGGDFGGSLTADQLKGVCCRGQCLYVGCRGDKRSWSGDAWGDALTRLTETVGESSSGLCGALIDDDKYLPLFSVQHDAVSHQGEEIGKLIGDTCNGVPGYIG